MTIKTQKEFSHHCCRRRQRPLRRLPWQKGQWLVEPKSLKRFHHGVICRQCWDLFIAPERSDFDSLINQKTCDFQGSLPGPSPASPPSHGQPKQFLISGLVFLHPWHLLIVLIQNLWQRKLNDFLYKILLNWKDVQIIWDLFRSFFIQKYQKMTAVSESDLAIKCLVFC